MLNMRQRRGVELLSDYDCKLKYHPGKANVVADALSKKEILRLSRDENLEAEKLYDADKKFEIWSDEKQPFHFALLETTLESSRGSWATYLPLAEFSYNNSYHSSIKCAPFEALYGRKCRSPLCWLEAGDKQPVTLDIIQETVDKVNVIKERPNRARSCQKSYADNRRKPLKFQTGDKVLLKVLP
ncbi:putative reverse transcriptase domain-containing protein [Tanacetum coccineum]